MPRTVEENTIDSSEVQGRDTGRVLQEEKLAALKTIALAMSFNRVDGFENIYVGG